MPSGLPIGVLCDEELGLPFRGDARLGEAFGETSRIGARQEDGGEPPGWRDPYIVNFGLTIYGSSTYG